MITEITEEEYYNLDKENDLGIFYFKDNCDRLHCIVLLPECQPIKQIWNIEKLAFEWMNKFIIDF